VAGLDGQGVLSQEAYRGPTVGGGQRPGGRWFGQASVNAARADAAASRAQLSQVQTRRTRTAVTSPVSGRVLERNARPGDISGGAARRCSASRATA
jgi:HlyD family secretion protein